MKVYVETNPETIYSGRVKDEVKTTEIRMWFETDEEIEVQSLADYTKQVRKEVCEEIKSAIKEKLVYPDNRVDCPFSDGFAFEDTICDVIDQIQGETK